MAHDFFARQMGEGEREIERESQPPPSIPHGGAAKVAADDVTAASSG